MIMVANEALDIHYTSAMEEALKKAGCVSTSTGQHLSLVSDDEEIHHIKYFSDAVNFAKDLKANGETTSGLAAIWIIDNYTAYVWAREVGDIEFAEFFITGPGTRVLFDSLKE
jgi:hypothetical protein